MMSSLAAEAEAALADAEEMYRDDPVLVHQINTLEKKKAALEAQRDAMRAYIA